MAFKISQIMGGIAYYVLILPYFKKLFVKCTKSSQQKWVCTINKINKMKEKFVIGTVWKLVFFLYEIHLW